MKRKHGTGAHSFLFPGVLGPLLRGSGQDFSGGGFAPPWQELVSGQLKDRVLSFKKDSKSGRKSINARAETIANSDMFRDAFKARAGSVRPESKVLSRRGADLIRHAGWVGGQHGWHGLSRRTCALG